MFGLSKAEKQYRSPMATFELGYLGNDKKEEFGLDLGTEPSGVALNERDWICLLTKRALVLAIRKYPELDPQKITLGLVDIQFKK